MPALDVLEIISRDTANVYNAVTKSEDGALRIQKTSNADTKSGVTLLQKTTDKADGADVAVFTADVLLENLTNLDDIQIILKTSKSSGLSHSPILILLRAESVKDGAKILYTDYNNGAQATKKLDTGAVVGKWFNIRIEYRVTALKASEVTGIEYKVYVNDLCICTSNNVYGTGLSVNGGTVSLPTVDSLYGVNLSFNKSMLADIFVDNSGLIKAVGDYTFPDMGDNDIGTGSEGGSGTDDNTGSGSTGSDNTGSDNTGSGGTAEPETILTFDKMPATSVLSINLGSFGDVDGEIIVGENTYEIVTEDEDKVLHISKGASGRDESGTVKKYSSGVSLRQYVTERQAGANLMIFEADIKAESLAYADIIQLHANAKGQGTSTSNSPFLGKFKIMGTADGSAIKNQSSGTNTSDTSAKVGEWFHLRVEYRVTSTDSAGAVTGIETRYYVNDDAVIISTAVYKNAANAFKVEDISSFALAFNSQNQGDFYVDDLSLRLVVEASEN